LRGPKPWVASAAGQLKVELEKGGSKWGFLYNSFFLGFLGFISGAVLAALVVMNIENYLDYAWLIAVGAVGGGLAVPPVIEMYFPRFEIVEKKKHRTRVVGGVFVTVVLGVAVNWISKAIGM
jgi:hypothetical protein